MKKWSSLKSAYAKRIVSCALALCLITGATFISSIFTNAADKVNLETDCNLTIYATHSNDADFVEDIESANVVMDVYKVANAVENKGADGYTFEVIEPFKEAVEIPEELDSKIWSELSQKAAQVVKESYENDEAIEPDYSTDAGKKINSLSAGLYLVLARGEEVEDYFGEVEFTETDDDVVITKSNIVTYAYSDDYEYSFLPEFVALPTKEPDTVTGEIDLSANTDWLYGTRIYMKPSAEPRYGSLRIIKDLLEYEKSEPTFCIFDIEAVKLIKGEMQNVYSDVVKMTFTDAKESYAIIEKIPAGAIVTVTEEYSGACYTLNSENDQQVTIVANDEVQVHFENVYHGYEKHCGSITNHFDPVLDEDGNIQTDKETGKPTYNWTKWEDTYIVVEEDAN